MKKMHRMIVFLTVFSLILALAGCGGQDPTTTPTTAPTTAPTTVPTTAPTTEPPITADQVYASVADAMKDAEATRLRMDLSYEMTVTEGEGESASTTDITFAMVMDTMASEDPFGIYTLMDMSVNAGDSAMDYTVELYQVEEEGSVVAYTQMFDLWTRSDSGMSVSEFLASGQMTEVSTDEVWSGSAKPEDMTLDEDTQTLNGIEVYVLRGSIPAGDMGEALSSLGVADPTEYADLSLPVVYYVDTQSYLIVRMEADMSFMTDLLDEVIAQSMVGTDTEGTQIELTIPNVIYDLEYGVPEIPPLPQEALDQTQETVDQSSLPIAGTATDMGDGSFVLPCGSEAVTITCPENWSGEVYDINNVWIYNEDVSLYGDYYYFSEWTEEDFQNQIQSDTENLKTAGIFISSEEGPAYDGYKTHTVMGDGESYCYAWTSIGEGYLLVVLADYTTAPDFDAQLSLLLGNVSPYTGGFAEPEGIVDLGNGTFTLPCGGETLLMTPPEGWDVEINSTDNLQIHDEEYILVGDYYYFAYMTRDDVLNLAQINADYLQSVDAFVSQGEGPTIEGYETWQVIGKGQSYYFAWREAGDGYLLVYVYDYSGTDDATELLPQFVGYLSPYSE